MDMLHSTATSRITQVKEVAADVTMASKMHHSFTRDLGETSYY